MKKAIIISALLLVMMYSISLIPIIEINEKIAEEKHELETTKSVDLSKLTINGENFLKHRNQYYFNSISANLKVKKQGNCGDENYFKEYPNSSLDKVVIDGVLFNSTECLMDYLGNDYAKNISFKGIGNQNAYLDKDNDIMLITRNNEHVHSSSTWIIVKDIKLQTFYREPIFYYVPLALLDPLRTHFAGTFYPLIDRIILPLYYLFLVFPFILKLTNKKLSNTKFFKTWVKINIAIAIIAVAGEIFFFYVSLGI